MQWNATAKRGFTTGTPWTVVAPDTANVAAQAGVDGSMLETYKGLIGVRKTSPALQHGGYVEVPTSRADVFAFLRSDAGSGRARPRGRELRARERRRDRQPRGDRDHGGERARADLRQRAAGGDRCECGAYPVPLAAQGAIWIKLE